jgi:hypothetical protein
VVEESGAVGVVRAPEKVVKEELNEEVNEEVPEVVVQETLGSEDKQTIKQTLVRHSYFFLPLFK